jgi:hypothetical protein
MTVHMAFDPYGPNHVKIRRDKNKHPFAFVQYEVRIREDTVVAKSANHAYRPLRTPMPRCRVHMGWYSMVAESVSNARKQTVGQLSVLSAW